MQIRAFTFNPFSENTYVVWDATRQCAIIDPGCHSRHEEAELKAFIASEGLTPMQVLLTHAHIDHIFGCDWAHRTYGLAPWLHQLDLPLLTRAAEQSLMFGVPLAPVPTPAGYLVPGQNVVVGETPLEVLFTPGHAPGHVVFYDRAAGQVLAGDVLFAGSIGRTDLPGGSLTVLMQSIFQVLLPLGDDVTVYSGHGPATTIGRERVSNPFLYG